MVWKAEDIPSPSSIRPRTEAVPRTVLIADEDAKLRLPLSSRLRELGYHVIEAENGFEFLEYLSELVADENTRERPEVIVCDVRLPGITSLGSIASLRPAWRAPMVVLTSSNNDPEIFRRARRLGAAGVFSAPYDIDSIVSFCTQLAPP
jgi:CheY-like chemotaxis protein